MSNSDWPGTLVLLNDVKKTINDSNDALSLKMNSTVGTPEEKPLDEVIDGCVAGYSEHLNGFLPNTQIYTKNLVVIPSGTEYVSTTKNGSDVIGSFTIPSDYETVKAKFVMSLKADSTSKPVGLFILNHSTSTPYTTLISNSILADTGNKTTTYTEYTLETVLNAGETYYIHLAKNSTSIYCNSFKVEYEDLVEQPFLTNTTQLFAPGLSMTAVVGSFSIADEFDKLLHALKMSYRMFFANSESSPYIKIYVSKKYPSSVYVSAIGADAETIVNSGWIGQIASYQRWYNMEYVLNLGNIEAGTYYVHVATGNYTKVANVIIDAEKIVSKAYSSVKSIQRGYILIAANATVNIDISNVIPEKCTININATNMGVSRSIIFNKLTLTDLSGAQNKVFWEVVENT
ncbi:hypothetical protein [Bacteroides sp.]|uniref:hypothetical protein n=1 Tax=Bacteroides sp. TaxID=29523 RepID=UPI002622F837|nr:hypothetical protein [Bacteroides sp.]MDD3040022.1 hypothetical protein [Bacteroides sp.]